MPSGLSAVKYFNIDFEDFSTLVQAPDGDFLWDEYSWDVGKDVKNSVEVPEKLLLGPWTEEMVKHLFWLIKAGARVDFLTTSGEVH